MMKLAWYNTSLIKMLHFITGLTISGAISLAVTEINLGKLKTLGHSLAFIVR